TARMCRVRKGMGMAKLVFGMNQSLDGYVDHMAFAPSPTLFRHFIEVAQGQAGSVYGRQMDEVMRYWDDDHPEWDEGRFSISKITGTCFGGLGRGSISQCSKGALFPITRLYDHWSGSVKTTGISRRWKGARTHDFIPCPSPEVYRPEF